MATPSQWRLVLDEVFYEGRLQDAPAFDETLHASICVEVGPPRPENFSPYSYRLGRQLKFLYVAITRARQGLWIVDNSKAAEPMKVFDTLGITLFFTCIQMYWDSKDQISIATKMPDLAAESTPEEWSKMGGMLVLGFRVVVHRMIITPQVVRQRKLRTSFKCVSKCWTAQKSRNM